MRVLVCVALGALAALCAACSGGDELSLDEYFARVDKLDEARSIEMARLSDELEQLGTNDVAGGISVLERQTDAREEFVDGLDDLEEPDEIGGLHQCAVTALRRAVEVFREYIENNRDAANVFDLLAGFAGVDFDAISAAVEQCEELERAAVRENIQIELDCE